HVVVEHIVEKLVSQKSGTRQSGHNFAVFLGTQHGALCVELCQRQLVLHSAGRQRQLLGSSVEHVALQQIYLIDDQHRTTAHEKFQHRHATVVDTVDPHGHRDRAVDEVVVIGHDDVGCGGV